MQLTIRQRAFLTKLIGLYGTIQDPVHYSVVADQPETSGSTAYDMLRLLVLTDTINKDLGV
ncbi:MAG: hypothetical protein SVY53_08095 [Chloroflexota bacterium]|nr:hypothetical protein [Chloroflexota bacterium]